MIRPGLVELPGRGQITVSEALPRFFHGENCPYVRDPLKMEEADTILGHGVQLPDLFEALRRRSAPHA